MSATLITVKHNFETAHRLPFLGGKCENLHGHSWWVEFEIENTSHSTGVDKDGLSVEYGTVKKIVRGFIDTYLDHGTMLGVRDPLVTTELHRGGHAFQLLGKVFVFGSPVDQSTEHFALKPWPTVESVAEMLCFKIQELLDDQFQGLFVNKVTVNESHVNKAIYLQGV